MYAAGIVEKITHEVLVEMHGENSYIGEIFIKEVWKGSEES